MERINVHRNNGKEFSKTDEKYQANEISSGLWSHSNSVQA